MDTSIDVVNLDKDCHIPMDISSNNLPNSMTENERHTKSNRKKEQDEVSTNIASISNTNS